MTKSVLPIATPLVLVRRPSRPRHRRFRGSQNRRRRRRLRFGGRDCLGAPSWLNTFGGARGRSRGLWLDRVHRHPSRRSTPAARNGRWPRLSEDRHRCGRGTNTDAVLSEDRQIRARGQTPTTADVTAAVRRHENRWGGERHDNSRRPNRPGTKGFTRYGFENAIDQIGRTSRAARPVASTPYLSIRSETRSRIATSRAGRATPIRCSAVERTSDARHAQDSLIRRITSLMARFNSLLSRNRFPVPMRRELGPKLLIYMLYSGQ